MPERFDDRIDRCVRTVERVDPRDILDVGCGDGFFLLRVRNVLSHEVGCSGLDADAQSVAKAQAHGIDCRVGLADQTLPFQDSSFDLVFAGEIIEHVADTDRMLEEVSRVLRPGGYLLLTTPNLLAWYNRILCVAGVTPMYVEHSYRASYGPSWSLRRQVGPAVGHLRIFTYTALRMVLAQNGFEAEWIHGAARIPVPGVWTVDRLISRMRPRMAAQLIVLARVALK
ncbi:MAG: class I SAM-dependent methyltransferase [Candidatus Dormibacteria bacterium]